MDEQLQKKVTTAIKLLRTFAGDDIVEISYSGGKDSDVILQLARDSGIKYRAIYKCTTIDPRGTIAHVKSKGVEVMRPKETFFQLIARKGYPSHRARFCCDTLKEYKVLDKAVQGVRRAESVKRSKRYKATDPIICLVYGSKKNHVNVCLPILNWSDEDVKNFIAARGIKCHSLYYDENGNFDVSRRLGCIGCPLASVKNRVDKFKKYPRYIKLWIKAGQKFLDTHPNAKTAQYFDGDACKWFYMNLFYSREFETFFQKDRTDLWGNRPNYKELLEKYFKIKL